MPPWRARSFVSRRRDVTALAWLSESHPGHIRSPEVALQLHIVGRVGENEVDAFRGERVHQLDAVAQQNLVDRQFGHGLPAPPGRRMQRVDVVYLTLFRIPGSMPACREKHQAGVGPYSSGRRSIVHGRCADELREYIDDLPGAVFVQAPDDIFPVFIDPEVAQEADHIDLHAFLIFKRHDLHLRDGAEPADLLLADHIPVRGKIERIGCQAPKMGSIRDDACHNRRDQQSDCARDRDGSLVHDEGGRIHINLAADQKPECAKQHAMQISDPTADRYLHVCVIARETDVGDVERFYVV